MSEIPEIKFCENCGDALECHAKAKFGRCWCFDFPVLKQIRTEFQECLCPKCLDAQLSYQENGNVVFTEEYHRRRGYCCKNNCRHCPYGEGSGET